MIYIVEDDSSIRELVVYTLRNTGFSAAGFENGRELNAAIDKNMPELLLLDIMLPDEDGISILKRIRANAETKSLPVIMLTAKGSEFDKVTGLDAGADDYVTKPFGMMELVSRIKALLRRSEKQEGEFYSCGEVALDVRAHMITVCGKPVETTLKEFELLRVLMKNAGRVMTRNKLLESVWDYEFDGETRTVDVHIRTLRTKLGSGGDIIETIRGVGYKIGK